MSAEDKFENTADKVGGKIQEGAGKLTGDKETESRGKAEAAKADFKDKIDDVKDQVDNAKDSVKDKLEDVKDSVKGTVEGLFGKDDK